MNSKPKRIASVIAIFLVFCTSQVYVSARLATPDKTDETQVAQPPDSVGILTTVSNKPIKVNEAAAITGTTILSGAGIETPEDVGATVSLGKLGSVSIEHDSKITLTFQAGSIKVLLIRGCVTLRANKGVTGEIDTARDSVSKTDPKKDGVLRVCHPDSARLASVPVAAGLSRLAMLAIIGGPAAAIIPVVTPGNNPSNSNPD